MTVVYVRKCQGCKEERSEEEVLCGNCGWDLTQESLRIPGQLDAAQESNSPSREDRYCMNTHLLEPGDEICFVCGASVAEDISGLEELPSVTATIIDGWLVLDRMDSHSEFYEQFIVERYGHRAQLTFYNTDFYPNTSIYDVLNRLPKDYIPQLISYGVWQCRSYDVVDLILQDNLLSLIPSTSVNIDLVRQIVSSLGVILDLLKENGLRHGNIKPENVFIRHRDPLKLILSGFNHACLSTFDLDTVPLPTSARYTAPEVIAGGISTASDWWSLGMIILEIITNSQCFSGINEKAFRIHVATRGVPLPKSIDPLIRVLLQGLLARDPDQRWQWPQIQSWLAGDLVEQPLDTNTEVVQSGPIIELSNYSYACPKAYALSAAETANWNNAKDLTIRGVVTTWLENRQSHPKIVAGVRQVASLDSISEDSRHALTLMWMNPSIPMIHKGDIVTPAWLIQNAIEGYEIITSTSLIAQLRQMNRELHICELYDRHQKARERAKILEIAIEEESFRMFSLVYSRGTLERQWVTHRRLYPASDHNGINSVMERQKIGDEELVILLSASIHQYESSEQILNKATTISNQANITFFDTSLTQKWLEYSRRDIYKAINELIENYSQCGITCIDEWANNFRTEKRIALAKALILLSVPKEHWHEPPRQQYIANILEFFEKKVASLAQRGPLVRMLIGRSSTKIDLSAIAGKQPSPSSILEHIIDRREVPLKIDPLAFKKDLTLESKLRHLVSHVKTYRRETGIDSLFLGFPFLIIQDNFSEMNNPKPRIAPVLLWPIRIDAENRDNVSICFDREREEVRLNPALNGLISSDEIKRWDIASKEILSHSSLRVKDIIDALGTLAEPRERTLSLLPNADYKVKAGIRQLVCSAVIFHAEFIGQSIGEDLREMRGKDVTDRAIESAFLIKKEFVNYPILPLISEKERYLTIESDPSQEKAVFQSRQSPGLLIEGPPGTGKSQTIVNIIRDCIGRKQTVLVICQKSAALEVLAKRLDAENLQNRYFYITHVNKDRASVTQDLRAQVDSILQSPEKYMINQVERKREEIAEKIEDLEKEINQHHTAIHSIDDVTGISYRTLLGQLIELENFKFKLIDVPVLRDILSRLTPKQLSPIEDVCSSVANLWLESRFENSPLEVLKSFPPDKALINDFIINFDAFIRAEEKRIEVTHSSIQSFEIEDPEPHRKWISKYDQYFRVLNELSWKNLKSWRQLFYPDVFGLSFGLDSIDILKGMNQKISDFTSHFTNFIVLEKERDEINHTSIFTFEINDSMLHRTWIKEQSIILENLKSDDWKNVASWYNLFAPKHQEIVSGADFIQSLEHIKQQLQSFISESFDHNLLIKLVEVSSPKLEKWISLALGATHPISFFSKLSLIRSLRLRSIQRILGTLNEASSNKRIDEFLTAASLEKKLRPIRKSTFKLLEKLYPEKKWTPSLLHNDLLSIIDQTICELHIVENAIKAVWSCPQKNEAISMAQVGNQQAYLEMMKQYEIALVREDAREKSQNSLKSLAPSFLDSLVNLCCNNISQNASNLEILQPIADSLPLTIEQHLSDIDRFNILSNNFFLTSSDTNYSNCVLFPLRKKLLEILTHLFPGCGPEESLPDLKKLPAIISALEIELKTVEIGFQAIKSCPKQKEAEAMVQVGAFHGYLDILAQYDAAFAREQARKQSFNALKKLISTLTEAFFDKCYANIQENITDVSDLYQINPSLQFLSAYQEFRLRSTNLSSATLNVLAILREKENELRSYSIDQVEDIVRRIIAREARLGWKAQIEKNFPILRIPQRELFRNIEALDKSSEEMHKLNQKFLASNIDTDIIQANRENWENITRLRGPRMRQLREIVEMGSEIGLMQLKPVWLMNPDTASRLLPLKGRMFDVVIFDEASQIPIENALPCLYRAKRVIISGDEQQMPPSNAFKKRFAGDKDLHDDDLDDFATESERLEFEESWDRREIKDSPDLLALGKTFLPKTMLQIHYRSKYRELIAFSNVAFYGNNLNVPVRHPIDVILNMRPLEVVQMDGIYENQTNLEEAERVIDILTELWRSSERPSIAVVTFNAKQADLIEDILAERAQNDRIFSQALTYERNRNRDGVDESFFVKNVENIQGDERDLVIFSTTFGRDKKGVFNRRFGLLGQAGGERRLNVAITRAREKIILVTSMPIQEVSDALSKRQAPKCPRDYLQAYLDYASKLSNGSIEDAHISLKRITSESSSITSSIGIKRDGFIISVESFIKSLGLVPLAIKEHDAFGLDFVIEDLQEKRFGIGIECDAHCHPILETARAREIWRPKVLRLGIPHVYRISSYSWYHHRNEEMQNLKRVLEKALKVNLTENAKKEVIEIEI